MSAYNSPAPLRFSSSRLLLLVTTPSAKSLQGSDSELGAAAAGGWTTASDDWRDSYSRVHPYGCLPSYGGPDLSCSLSFSPPIGEPLTISQTLPIGSPVSLPVLHSGCRYDAGTKTVSSRMSAGGYTAGNVSHDEVSAFHDTSTSSTEANMLCRFSPRSKVSRRALHGPRPVCYRLASSAGWLESRIVACSLVQPCFRSHRGDPESAGGRPSQTRNWNS